MAKHNITLFWVSNGHFLGVTSHSSSRETQLCGFLCEGTDPILEGSTLNAKSPPKGSTSNKHSTEGWGFPMPTCNGCDLSVLCSSPAVRECGKSQED